MGTEDLGGGLKAGFHFEGGMNPDTGTPAGFQLHTQVDCWRDGWLR